MNRGPLVSIVIPVYNGVDYLAEAIDSALAQTYDNIEILVINDGSTDDGRSRDIALSYGDRIRYFEKRNGGVSTALNLAIKEMRGEYFSWLSHDDVYYPRKIELQLQFLMDNQTPSAITYTDFCYINNFSELTSEMRVRSLKPESFKIEFISGGLIHGCSLLIPKKCFEVCGGFDETLRTTQDYDLWFKFSEANFAFYHIPEILVKGRVHEKQVSVRTKALCDEECNLMYKSFLKKLDKAEIRKNYHGTTIEYYLNYSNRMMDYRYLKAALYALKLSAVSPELFKIRNFILVLRTGMRLITNLRQK